MTKSLKLFQITIVCLVLSMVIIAATKLTFDGYYGFYYENRKVDKTALSKVVDQVYEFYPVSFFRSYTGFETGYGFFGPNVSSDFILIFKVYDENQNLYRIIESVDFHSKEGKMRFATLNSLFLDKLTDTKNKKYNQYLDIVIKQISKYVARDYPKNFRIETKLYLYDFPTIKAFNNGEKNKLFFVRKYVM